MKLSIVAAIVALGISLSGCVDYSEGTRAGLVNKFSKKGIVCKTWEGEMTVQGGGFRNSTSTDSEGRTNTSVIANVWEFSVGDESLVREIQNAMDSGKRVKLTYSQKLWVPPCQADTTYFVKKVQVLD